MSRGLAAVAATLALAAAGAAGCGTDRANPGQRLPPPALLPLPREPHARPVNVYAAIGSGQLRGAARSALPRVYVPNSRSNTLDVIDPRAFRRTRTMRVGGLPQHVTPSYDLSTLWVNDNGGNDLVPIDPKTARRRGSPVPVADPYNLYFTPDGRAAIVVAEGLERLDFRDPRTMRLARSLRVPCPGVNHMDFSVNGGFLVASCEFGGALVKVGLHPPHVVARLVLPTAAVKPQDVRLSPDGSVMYVADGAANGLWEIDPARFRILGFLPTGRGAHGIVVSRDGHRLYVSNRTEGSVSVVDADRGRVVAKWPIPGGSPDMGGVSADGRTLWLSGRYGAEVYAIDTQSGALRARIRVGQGPHGLSVWPQPGRYSLGHTGNMR